MIDYRLISLVALLGWLILALSAFRARQINARAAVVMALTWGAIFLFVAWIFTTMG